MLDKRANFNHKPLSSKHSKSLLVNGMRWDFLQWICSPNTKTNCHPILASPSQYSHARFVKKWNNHLPMLVLPIGPLDGRCITTISSLVVSLDDIINNGGVTIINNMLSGHSWWSYLVMVIMSLPKIWVLDLTWIGRAKKCIAHNNH